MMKCKIFKPIPLRVFFCTKSFHRKIFLLKIWLSALWTWMLRRFNLDQIECVDQNKHFSSVHYFHPFTVVLSTDSSVSFPLYWLGTSYQHTCIPQLEITSFWMNRLPLLKCYQDLLAHSCSRKKMILSISQDKLRYYSREYCHFSKGNFLTIVLATLIPGERLTSFEDISAALD